MAALSLGWVSALCVHVGGGGHFIISLEETIPLEKSCCLLHSRALFRGGGKAGGDDKESSCPRSVSLFAAPPPLQGKEGKNSRLNVGK